jgi:hypothetical protein
VPTNKIINFLHRLVVFYDLILMISSFSGRATAKTSYFDFMILDELHMVVIMVILTLCNWARSGKGALCLVRSKPIQNQHLNQIDFSIGALSQHRT